MECQIEFEEVQGKDGKSFEVCALYVGKCRIVLRDYNAVDKLRFIKSLLGV